MNVQIRFEIPVKDKGDINRLKDIIPSLFNKFSLEELEALATGKAGIVIDGVAIEDIRQCQGDPFYDMGEERYGAGGSFIVDDRTGLRQ